MDDGALAYRMSVGQALLGTFTCGVGLYVAALSNPRRYTLSVQDDRYIYGALAAGVVLTLIGIGLFLHGVKGTTSSLPVETRRQVNAGIGIGFALQCASFLVADQRLDFPSTAFALVIPGIAAFTWGTMKYAQGKGYAHAVGLLGLLGVIGLIGLILMPDRTAGSVGGRG